VIESCVMFWMDFLSPFGYLCMFASEFIDTSKIAIRR
jgi:hypothetical protein